MASLSGGLRVCEGQEQILFYFLKFFEHGHQEKTISPTAPPVSPPVGSLALSQK